MTKGFRKAVTTAGINEHLKGLRGRRGGGNRVSGVATGGEGGGLHLEHEDAS